MMPGRFSSSIVLFATIISIQFEVKESLKKNKNKTFDKWQTRFINNKNTLNQNTVTFFS